MISMEEIADINSSISSTRWAFASVIRADIVIISVVVIAGLVGHFVGKELDSSFYNGVAMLLGIPTGLIVTSKSLQGFEPRNKISS